MPVVDTTQSFATGDTVTSTTLNNIMDQSVFVAGAVVPETGLAITAGGQMTISDNSLPGGKITNGTITSAKIENETIVNDDISPSAGIVGSKLADLTITAAKIASDAVTTIKILNANVTPAKLSEPLTLGTSQNSTSGTNIDFTSIPSWAKKITVMLAGVSTNGASELIVQLGDSGGFETTGYVGSTSFDAGRQSFTNGIGLGTTNSAAYENSGIVVFAKVNSSENKWVASGNITQSGSTYVYSTASLKETSGVLDKIRITTAGGVNTFDTGQINIMYE